MNSERYSVVALDQDTGEIYFSPEAIKTYYSLEEAASLLMVIAEQTKPLRRLFFLLPYNQAIHLWNHERQQDDEADRIIN